MDGALTSKPLKCGEKARKAVDVCKQSVRAMEAVSRTSPGFVSQRERRDFAELKTRWLAKVLNC